MSGQVLQVAWYRFTATFGRRWGGYLSIVLLIGLTGGTAMGSIAAARRTQSSFATFLASTNPSDMNLANVSAPVLTNDLERLPGVQQARSALYINAFPLARTGAAIIPPSYVDDEVTALGSLDGEYFDQDRVTVTRGRMAGLDAANEFVATTQAAQLLGWHVGQVVPVGFYTGAQTNEPGFGTTKMKPTLQLDMKLVGLVVFNNEVVLDEVDRYPAFLLFTPAVTRPLSAGVQDATYGLKLRDGAQGVPAVEREIIRALPKGTTYNFHVTSVVEGQVDRTVKPEAIALGAFGAIAMLAALLIAMQVIGRQLQAGSDDLEVLRALGASRTVVMADGLLGVLGSVLLGSLLAVGVAIGLSPLSPIGPVRPVDPSAGTAIDSSVLGFGLLVLIGAIGAGAAALAYRSSSRLRQQGTTRATLGSSFARLVASSGAAAPAVAGDGGARRRRRPLCCRTGPRSHRGTGAFGTVRHRARHGDRRRDAHLWQWAQHVGLPPGPLRLELELCLGVKLHRPSPSSLPSGRRPLRRRVVWGELRQRPDRRPDRAHPLGEPKCKGDPSGPVRALPRSQQPNRPRRGDTRSVAQERG